MKKLLLVMLVLAFCIPASAELVIYKITCRETLFDRTDDCPEKVSLRETMWLILDVDPAEVDLLQCGDDVFLGDDAVPTAGIFKTWKLDRWKLWDDGFMFNVRFYILDGQVCVEMPFCSSRCVMKGRTRGGIAPRSLNGHCVSFGDTAFGKAACSARLDRRMMRKFNRENISTVGDALDYLESIQPYDAIQGDACDPLMLP